VKEFPGREMVPADDAVFPGHPGEKESDQQACGAKQMKPIACQTFMVGIAHA